jgi:hypothetical protein
MNDGFQKHNLAINPCTKIKTLWQPCEHKELRWNKSWNLINFDQQSQSPWHLQFLEIITFCWSSIDPFWVMPLKRNTYNNSFKAMVILSYNIVYSLTPSRHHLAYALQLIRKVSRLVLAGCGFLVGSRFRYNNSTQWVYMDLDLF